MVKWVLMAALILMGGCAGQGDGDSEVGPDALALVDGGAAQAVVVTADEASPAALLAVEELVEHVRLATGVELAVVTESAAAARPEPVRVYVGETQSARAAGLDTSALANDGFYLRVDGDAVYVLGAEDEAAYNSRSGRNGTLYGVYELLERAVGVRWLWPGALGVHVPLTDTVTLAPADEAVHPALKGRYYRIEHVNRAARDYRPETERLAFSREGLDNYLRDVEIFLRRHRMGFSKPRSLMSTTHIFEGWWQRSGEQHPEWFKMNEAGQRVGPTLCVSNPELARYIVESERTVWESGGVKNFTLGEVDVRVYCHCAECMDWDDPLPEGWPTSGPNRPISNRYARFAQKVRDMVRQRHPEADFIVTYFIYFNYFHEPTIDIDLTGTSGVFCPWFSGFNPWYPMPEDEHQRLMDIWSGWVRTGTEMHYRPNYLLTGYVMPHLSTRQTGEMFRHAAANGALSVDFDSLWAHWAVKGPMLYMHMRLTTDPTCEVAEALREYFTAFGPAAAAVQAYFDYWETYSAHEVARGGVSWSNPDRARRLYPDAAFAPARDLLAQARDAVENDPNPVYAERVRFLEVGLRHAELTANFIGTLRGGSRVITNNAADFAASRQALQELIAFRREHEHLYFADLIAAAFSENRGLQIEELFDDNFVVQDGSGHSLEEPWEQWFFRTDPQERGVAGNWYIADNRESGIKSFDDGAGQAFEFDRGHWTPVRAPARLSETPVGAYLGYGWYATTFTAPEGMAGRAAVLHFEGVDEQAWVYLNGRYIGEHTVESEGQGVGELWDKPFTISVPADVIRGNGKNLLVVRIHASTGEAGIWREVGLSVPAD